MNERVVHCKKDQYDVYIGRGSLWGNPFVVGKDGDRVDVVNKYEEYVRNSPKIRENLFLLKGKVLGCYCAPKLCHGEVLIKLLKEFGYE